MCGINDGSKIPVSSDFCRCDVIFRVHGLRLYSVSDLSTLYEFFSYLLCVIVETALSRVFVLCDLLVLCNQFNFFFLNVCTILRLALVGFL